MSNLHRRILNWWSLDSATNLLMRIYVDNCGSEEMVKCCASGWAETISSLHISEIEQLWKKKLILCFCHCFSISVQVVISSRWFLTSSTDCGFWKFFSFLLASKNEKPKTPWEAKVPIRRWESTIHSVSVVMCANGLPYRCIHHLISLEQDLISRRMKSCSQCLSIMKLLFPMLCATDYEFGF